MTQKWEVCKHAAQWPEGSKASEATGSGGVGNVLLTNIEIQERKERARVHGGVQNQAAVSAAVILYWDVVICLILISFV